MAESAVFNFNGLPAELQHQVIKFAVIGSPHDYARYVAFDQWRWLPVLQKPLDKRLLQTSRMFHHIALKTYYALATFRLGLGLSYETQETAGVVHSWLHHPVRTYDEEALVRAAVPRSSLLKHITVITFSSFLAASQIALRALLDAPMHLRTFRLEKRYKPQTRFILEILKDKKLLPSKSQFEALIWNPRPEDLLPSHGKVSTACTYKPEGPRDFAFQVDSMTLEIPMGDVGLLKEMVES